MPTPEELFDSHDDRTLTTQSASVDNSKLIVTFSTGIAGAFAGAALQMNRTVWAWPALVLLTIAVVLTAIVFVSDRLAAPGFDDLRSNVAMPDAVLVDVMRLRIQTAIGTNKKVVRRIWLLTIYQAVASLGASVFAAIWLLNAPRS